GGGNARGQSIREQVGPAALAKQVDNGAVCCHIATRCATQCLAESARDHVDALVNTTQVRGAAPFFAHKTHSVGIVNHDHRAVAFGQVTNAFQVGHDAVHGKHAIGGNQLEACARLV